MKGSKPIYLDYHATTPADPEVVASMMPYMTEAFGNPASRSHPYGWIASEAVEMARQQVAKLLGASSTEIFFNSGATEGLNMAIKGLADASQIKGKHIITLATEHHAVLDPLDWLRSRGFEVTILPVTQQGLLEPERLQQAIRSDTIMAIVMWANNETGVIQPMPEIGDICAMHGIPLISDITQAAGKVPVNPGSIGVGIAAMSAHKMYGPKGVGALYMDLSRLKVQPSALIHGGGHERGFRSGTLNVPGIVGFGTAANLRHQRMNDEMNRIGQWRNELERLMQSEIPEVSVNGGDALRLPTVTNLRVKFVDSQAVISRVRARLAISSGSACSSANPEPSHVLMAMGLGSAGAKGSLRISLGAPTTREDWMEATSLLKEAIAAERALNPVWDMHNRGMDVAEFG